MADKKKTSVPKKSAPKKKGKSGFPIVEVNPASGISEGDVLALAKTGEMVEVTIHDKSIPIDAIPQKPERTAKVVFDNDYCRIVEDYDKAEECVFYAVTNKTKLAVPNETHIFSTIGEAEKHARRWGLK